MLSSLPRKSGCWSSPNENSCILILRACWLDVGLNCCLHTCSLSSRGFSISASLGNLSSILLHLSPSSGSLTNPISTPFEVHLYKKLWVSSRKKVKLRRRKYEGNNYGIASVWCCHINKSAVNHTCSGRTPAQEELSSPPCCHIFAQHLQGRTGSSTDQGRHVQLFSVP